MESKEFYRAKIENQISKWKTTIDGLKGKVEQAEAGAKSKLHEQLDTLHEKRAKAEEILEELTTTGQEAWGNVKSGVDEAWRMLTRGAKRTLAKAREAFSDTNRDEEIRQIAYRVWQDEGCPHGRHVEHWVKAESIWREQQERKRPGKPARAEAARPRVKKDAPAQNKPRRARSKSPSTRATP
jgi:hypothetical protein